MTRAWMPLVIAFVLGTCVGFTAARCGASWRFHPHRGSTEMRERMLTRFSSTLKLTPDQRTRVAAILDAKRQKMDALRAEITPRFEELRASTSTEIRQLLTPEQQQRFDAMEAKREAHRKERRDRWAEHDEMPSWRGGAT